jgi:hypothetical protein
MNTKSSKEFRKARTRQAITANPPVHAGGFFLRVFTSEPTAASTFG